VVKGHWQKPPCRYLIAKDGLFTGSDDYWRRRCWIRFYRSPFGADPFLTVIGEECRRERRGIEQQLGPDIAPPAVLRNLFARSHNLSVGHQRAVGQVCRADDIARVLGTIEEIEFRVVGSTGQ
jgi:hypothetical protein